MAAKVNPLDKLASAQPAKWDRDFRVPKLPSLSDELQAGNWKEAMSRFDEKHREWSRNLEQAIGERLGALTTATATTAATTITTATPAIDNTLTARVTALETLIARVTNGRVIVLCAGYNPSGLGPDYAEFEVPNNSSGSPWTIDRIIFRVGQAGGQPSIAIEKSTVSDLFTPTLVNTITLDLDAYEAVTTDPMAPINPGDKLRFNVLDLGTAANWTVAVELSLE